MLKHDDSCAEWERRRLEALYRLNILDTPPEARFDTLVHMVARTFEVPIAMISLVDERRLWFKARVGLEEREYPRENSLCAQAIHEQAIMVVENTVNDARFADTKMVTGKPAVRFYASVPLHSLSRLPLGTLCIFDTQPRRFSHRSRTLLIDLAGIVSRELTHDFLPKT